MQQVYADKTEIACESKSWLDGSLQPLPQYQYIMCPTQAAQQTQLMHGCGFKSQ